MKYKKIILRVFASLFVFASFCNLYLYYLPIHKLLSVTGPVNGREIIFVQGLKRKYKSYPMVISLKNFSHKFRLMDVYNESFESIQRQLNIGDTVTLFYRTKVQAFMGVGKRFDIFQVEKNGKVIFPFETTKRQDIITFLMMLFFAIFCYGLSLAKKKSAS